MRPARTLAFLSLLWHVDTVMAAGFSIEVITGISSGYIRRWLGSM